MTAYLLYESSSGYALFEAGAVDEIGQSAQAVQEAIGDMERFGRVMKMTAFKPFTSAADALEQINAVSESVLSDDLKAFLEQNLPKVKAGKKAKFTLGVSEPKLGAAIHEELGSPCVSNEHIGELLRGVRTHFARFLKGVQEADLQKAQLGLAHSYSRAKVKFNVNRADNMIIQSIALLDTLDKDVNTFIMRVREWYGWHFPELVKVVPDNYQYARIALLLKDKSQASEEHLPGMTEILGDEDKSKEVLEAARSSMGQDISPIDLVNIEQFAKRVISLAEYRKDLHTYLSDKMLAVAPNLSSLIGEVVGARLISHAGSLTNLAKYPASTVQILGAEKALFRALKTKGNTPKYGLIFHSSFIGRASAKNKGRISRYLANKCSIASRIDCFSDFQTSAFGEKLKEQVEERLDFYDKGTAPRKNIDMMKAAISELPEDEQPKKAAADPSSAKKEKKKKKKDKGDAMEVEEEEAAAEAPKSDKKKKKRKAEAEPEEDEDAPKSEKKKKKKKDKD
eukprot:CAMPEP_0170144548 /NCGR_PEP_ID=MMETSP0033_2-20121228/14317_1 /TAXON_ID=195969 /ORGANISM="Dolichomastix tenuilepis, Strain CCMP3274" /LENGTH=509 /DNA_ID=CAMNT_0010381055 /DNA_START=220 /DNA_END=1749 /DNA_ORIENTATION=-